MGRFTGKTIIITGASSGIGAASARRFAEEGAKVALLDIQVEAGEALAKELGPDHFFLKCDVTQGEQLMATIDKAAEKLGGLDIIFNNAGTGAMGDVASLPPADWHRIIDLVLNGTFYGCKAAIPHMRQRGGGVIVNTGSVSGLFGDYGLGAYNAAKAGVINLTRTMAMDHGPEGIRVNCICPGYVMTPAFGARGHTDHDAFVEMIPLGRGAQAGEIASVAAFLASDDASYVNGAAIVVDGGLTVQTGQPSTPKAVARLMAQARAAE